MTTVSTEAGRSAAPTTRPTLGTTSKTTRIRSGQHREIAGHGRAVPQCSYWPFTQYTDPDLAAADAAALAIQHIRTGADMSAVLADAYQSNPESAASVVARATYVEKLMTLARAGLEG